MQTNLFQKDHKQYIEVVREKVRIYGKSEATISELLAIVMGNTAKADVCGKLAALSVRDLFAMSATDFSSIEGISKTLGERLEASISLAKLLSEQSMPETVTISSPEDAFEVFKFLRHEEQEQLVVAFLNTKNQVIGRETIFKGSLDSSIVHPREIYRRAVQKAAKSIIVAHQHPSGSCNPSPEDIAVTKRLVECGDVLGVELFDHLIIGDGTYISLKEKGYM